MTPPPRPSVLAEATAPDGAARFIKRPDALYLLCGRVRAGLLFFKLDRHMIVHHGATDAMSIKMTFDKV